MLDSSHERSAWFVLAMVLTLTLLLSSEISAPVLAQPRKSTRLTLSPETFMIAPSQSIALTAKLTSDGQPLAGKQIVFTATLGSVNPIVVVTDGNGVAVTMYTAPEVGARTSITVTALFSGDLMYESSTAVSYGTIEVSLPLTSISGASFIVPETLRDDVSSYKEAISQEVSQMLPITLPTGAFILANPDGLYLVFSDHYDEGYASIEGWILPRSITLANTTLSVVVAKSANFSKEGVPVALSEILADPEGYAFELVKVDAHRRQISILYDPDEPHEVEFPITIGYLTEEPLEPLNVVREALDKGSRLSFNASEELIRDIIGEPNRRLWLFNFKYEYWYDCRSITNGIVIPIDHPIFKLLKGSLPILGRFAGLGNAVALYDVGTDIPYTNVPSVTELKEDTNNYVGKVVGLKANVYGGYISIQEVIEHNTPCSEDYVYVKDSGCVNLVVDTRLDGFVIWNTLSTPPKRGELMLATGVSSFHQDRQFVNESGVFELIGKVVYTKQISESLPDGIALIIYRAKKVGDIDFEGLTAEVKEEIEQRIGELYWVLQDLYPYEKQPNVPLKIPREVFAPKAPIFVRTPEEIPEIRIEKNFTLNIDIVKPERPIRISISNSPISNITIKVKGVARNVTIFFERLVEKPPELPSPPGPVYAYHEISASIPEDLIEKARLTFWVAKEWLATHGATNEDVLLLRYHAEKWMELPTRTIGENATHYIFTAETPGLSTFALTVKKRPLETGVEGYVSDAVTGSPLKGVKVIALPKPTGLIRVEAETDDMGHYSLNLTPGGYVLVASADGYADWSEEVDVSPDEVKRVDFRLEPAVAEFVEDWYGVKFELAVVGNLTWGVGSNATFKVSAVVSDMGENREVEFRQLKLELFGTGVSQTLPISAKLSVGGIAFSREVSLRVLDGFGLMAPNSSDTIPLWLTLEGAVTDEYGTSWPGTSFETANVRVRAPASPVSVKVEAPESVYIGGEFDVKVRLENGGKYPIKDVEISLAEPFGTQALSPLEAKTASLSPGEVFNATFRLKAMNFSTASSIMVGYSYKTLWDYLVSELPTTMTSIAISKIPTTINISVKPSEVDVGGEVTIKGSISPPIRALITLEITKPDETYETVGTTSTSEGSFSFEVKLDKEGAWKFKAAFDGDLTHEASTSAEVQATAKPKGCLIATATFGSELAGPVQFLRGFRDEVVEKTFAGRCFIEAFNAWYYSWAPYVAQAEWSCEPLRQEVKYAIYPLVGILHVAVATYGALSFNPEFGVITAGLLASSLIGLVYVMPIALVASVIKKKRPPRRAVKALALAWLVSLAGTCASVIVQLPGVAMILTSAFVLASMTLAVTLTLRMALKLL